MSKNPREMSRYGWVPRPLRELAKKTAPLWTAPTQTFDLNGRPVHIKSPSAGQTATIKSKVFTSDNVERARRHFVAIDLPRAATILDVGANIGYYSLLYAALCPDAKVFAFEPSRFNFAFLRSNTRAYPNVVPIQLGLHDQDAIVGLHSHPWQDAKAARTRTPPDTGFYSIYAQGKMVEQVRLRPLDRVVEERVIPRPVRFIKVDVEGDELNVLKGAHDVLVTDSPALEIEVNESNRNLAGTSYAELREHLSTLGYSPFRFDGTTLLPVREARFDSTENLTFLKQTVHP